MRPSDRLSEKVSRNSSARMPATGIIKLFGGALSECCKAGLALAVGGTGVGKAGLALDVEADGVGNAGLTSGAGDGEAESRPPESF